MPITHTLLSSYNTNHNVKVCSKNLIRLHIADLMPHFFQIGRKANWDIQSTWKRLPFHQLKCVILQLYQSENWGLLSAKKTEYFDWKILQSLILAHCPCQRCNWEFVISILHHLTKDYTALMGFCGSDVTAKCWLNKQIITCIFVNKQNTCFRCIE